MLPVMSLCVCGCRMCFAWVLQGDAPAQRVHAVRRASVCAQVVSHGVNIGKLPPGAWLHSASLSNAANKVRPAPAPALYCDPMETSPSRARLLKAAQGCSSQAPTPPASVLVYQAGCRVCIDASAPRALGLAAALAWMDGWVPLRSWCARPAPGSCSAEVAWRGVVCVQGSGSQQHGVVAVVAHGKGHVAMYGDSNCLDSSHINTHCYQFLVRCGVCEV